MAGPTRRRAPPEEELPAALATSSRPVGVGLAGTAIARREAPPQPYRCRPRHRWLLSARLTRHLRVQLGRLGGQHAGAAPAVGLPPRDSLAPCHPRLPRWPPSLASLAGLPPWPPSLASLLGLPPWPSALPSLPCPRCPGVVIALGQVPVADHILRARHDKCTHLLFRLPTRGRAVARPSLGW
jgi:hypothetical protein